MIIDYLEFSDLIDTLFDSLQKVVKPLPAIKGRWHSRLNNIDPEEIREAFEYLEQNLDTIPANFSKVLRQTVFRNRRTDIFSQSKNSFGQCSDCNATGIFKVRENTEFGYPVERIYFCSQCDNYKSWTNQPGKRVSKKELEDKGVLFKPYDKVLKNSSPAGDSGTVSDIKKLATDFSDSHKIDKLYKYAKQHSINPHIKEK